MMCFKQFAANAVAQWHVSRVSGTRKLLTQVFMFRDDNLQTSQNGLIIPEIQWFCNTGIFTVNCMGWFHASRAKLSVVMYFWFWIVTVMEEAQPELWGFFLLEINSLSQASPIPTEASEQGQHFVPSQALAPSATTDGLCPSAAISGRSLAEEMTTFLAEAYSVCWVLTEVADFEAFSVVGMIRGPTEIDFVPTAGNSQRSRVVPTQWQEQRALARGTCEERGRERIKVKADTQKLSLTPSRARVCFCKKKQVPFEIRVWELPLYHESMNNSSCLVLVLWTWVPKNTPGSQESNSKQKPVDCSKTRLRPGFCFRHYAFSSSKRRSFSRETLLYRHLKIKSLIFSYSENQWDLGGAFFKSSGRLQVVVGNSPHNALGTEINN